MDKTLRILDVLIKERFDDGFRCSLSVDYTVFGEQMGYQATIQAGVPETDVVIHYDGQGHTPEEAFDSAVERVLKDESRPIVYD